MAVPARPSADRPAPRAGGGGPVGELVRFDGVQRFAHWATAGLFLVLILTGAALYVPAVAGMVGRRPLVERVHVDAGFALAVPLLVSLSGPWGRALRRDLGRLNRWTEDDRRWLRCVLNARSTTGVPKGKFNAGQKLNAAFTAGVLLVMLLSGAVMHWPLYWPLSWRTGATFVHDVVAYAFVLVVIAHVAMAFTHPSALRSMLTGRVGLGWARRHAPLWLEELDAAAGSPAVRSDEPGPG